MDVRDAIRGQIAKARQRHITASKRYDETDKPYYYYDKAYYLGRAHALELLLEDIELSELEG